MAQQPSSEAGRNEMSKGSRILVVDDNVDTAGGLARLLRLLGNDVQVAITARRRSKRRRRSGRSSFSWTSGCRAWTATRSRRCLRKDGSCKNAVIVAVSGYGQEEDRRRAREAGFDHHLVKPVDFDTLTTLLRGG